MLWSTRYARTCQSCRQGVCGVPLKNMPSVEFANMQATQRQELADFALVERRALTDAESAMAAQCATLQAQLDEQGAALGVARTEAAVMQSKLEACQAEVGPGDHTYRWLHHGF